MSDQGCPLNCGGAPQLKFYQAFTFATPIIFTLVLLLLFCVLYVRRRQTARAVAQIRAHFSARGLFSAWPMDHGLTKAFRDALPIIVFDESFAASREDNQCAVCLSDYQLNEKLQQLPLCDHVFHVECIDEWLTNNATCPICRTSLLQPGKVESLTPTQHQQHQLQHQQQQQQQQQHAAPECSKSQEEAAGTSRAGEAAPAPAAVAAAGNEASMMQQDKELKQPGHRNSLSMEDAVKDSAAAEHIIHIER